MGSGDRRAQYRCFLRRGVITNILGWRDYSGGSGTDVDATINTAFHSRTLTEQDQVSEEFRYAGAGNDTQLPNTAAFGGVGATFSPLIKGRVLGVEVN